MQTDKKAMRDRANEVAKRVAARLRTLGKGTTDSLRTGKPWDPKCHRITSRRGWGHPGGHFSVPAWAAWHPAYFDYYAAHETVHCLVGEAGHGPRFQEAETLALEALGLRIQYSAEPGQEAYPCAITNTDGSILICRFNKNFVEPPKIVEEKI